MRSSSFVNSHTFWPFKVLGLFNPSLPQIKKGGHVWPTGVLQSKVRLYKKKKKEKKVFFLHGNSK